MNDENEMELALKFKSLTGDWVSEIECAGIGAEGRIYEDQVVYFGPESDLRKDEGKAAKLIDASIIDKYEFNEQHVGFHFNSDKECAK